MRNDAVWTAVAATVDLAAGQRRIRELSAVAEMDRRRLKFAKAVQCLPGIATHPLDFSEIGQVECLGKDHGLHVRIGVAAHLHPEFVADFIGGAAHDRERLGR